MSQDASFYNRLEVQRWAGFAGFTVNKAFVVSDRVPDGHIWLIFAASALHLNATQRVIHVFAIPPGDAGLVINPVADTTSPIFLGTINNPPLKSGVLISVGGNNGLADTLSNNANSVNALIGAPFFLPSRWKLLAFIDSADGALAGSGLILDVAYIDVTSDECIPDFL